MRGLPIAFVGFVLLAVAGHATPIFFTGSGGTSPNGEAEFTINSNSITVELWNTGTAGNVDDISDELDGINFTLTGGSATLGAVTGSAPLGAIDCTANPCTTASPQPTQPFGWGVTGTSTFLLAAGDGSYHPDAIVNGNFTFATNTKDAQHNPLLLSSATDSGSGVTFTIAFTGTAPTGIGNVVFDFGTGPTTEDGVVCTTACGGNVQALPEPGSMALSGSGLIALAFLSRKFRFGRR